MLASLLALMRIDTDASLVAKEVEVEAVVEEEEENDTAWPKLPCACPVDSRASCVKSELVAVKYR